MVGSRSLLGSEEKDDRVAGNDYAQANGGQWPHEDNTVLASFVSLYEGRNKHATGEAVPNRWGSSLLQN